MEHPDEVIRAVAERALPAWGLEGAKLELISRSENVVFRVETENDRAWALRVHRPGYHTLAELESEPIWTAALNAAGVSMAHDLRKRGIAVALLHPGMVRTDMTHNRGVPVEESVAGLLERIDGLTLDSSGTFWHADGRVLPW